MKVRIIFLTLGIFVSANVYSMDLNEIKEKLRVFVEENFTQELAVKLFGEKAAEVQMPPLPQLVKDARSTDVYDKQEKKSNLSSEDDQKYNLAFIQEIIEVTRNAPANDNELARWMNTMDQGATREGIYRAMVLDSLYAGLENGGAGLSPRSIEFTQYFLEKFIGQAIDEKLLQQINLYTIKREVAEKALEIIDSFSNEDELHRWYAVLSGELAVKYPQVFANKVRKYESMTRHLNWAKEAPVQHLKSEVVIKIHAIYNNLK